MKQADIAMRIIAVYQAGLITEAEATQQLEGQEVRGSFRDDDSFIGYDYDNQEWIDTKDEVNKS